MNFVAAANMTIAVGATPVFADIVATDEPTVSPAHIEALIGPKTRAIVVMHYARQLVSDGGDPAGGARRVDSR